MIQDIAPHQLSNEYRPQALPRAGEWVFFVRGQELAVRRIDGDEPGFELPCVGDPALTEALGAWAASEERREPVVVDDVSKNGEPIVLDAEADPSAGRRPPTAGLTYLFSIDDRACWLAPDAGAAEPPAGFSLVSNRDLRREHRGPRELMFAAYTAVHLAGWYATHRRCGVCGSPMAHHAGMRAMECTSCHNVVFPRLNPAVIVCVRDPKRDKIVITRYARGRYVPIDALVAGFVEIGETLEECVRREVREELGLEVDNISYYKSQPWGVAGDILSGFWCDVVGDPTIRMDEEELGRAVWVSPEDVTGQPDDFSLTNEMMCAWRDAHLKG